MGAPSIGPIFELTQVSNAVFPYPGAQTARTTYTGTITNGAVSATRPNGGWAGRAFIVSGFANLSNNGEFLCVSSSATTLVLNNRNGIAAVSAGSPPNIGQAQLVVAQGNPLQYATKVSNLYSNNQGDNVFVAPLAGDTLIACAIGLKSLDPFDQLHGASPEFGYLQGLNDFMPNAPTISDTSAPGGSPASENDWVLVANINLADADYTPGSYPPTAWPTTDWSLDGYYPSLYIWVCTSANGGNYAVNLNSVYQDGIAAPLDLAAGKPIFDGGVDFFVTNFTGMTSVAVDEGYNASIGISTANPAVASSITATGYISDSTPSAVTTQLGSAANYALLAYSGITNTGTNVITGGNIGSSSVPATLDGMTLTSPAVIDNAAANQARIDGQAAFVHYSGLAFTSLGGSIDLSTSGVSGSNVYNPGNYSFGAALMTTGIVLDGAGTYIFKGSSTINLASGQSVTYINGACPADVVWLVGSSFSQSGTGGQMVGTILAYASITFAGTTTLLGRALAVGGGNGDVTFAAGGSVTTTASCAGSGYANTGDLVFVVGLQKSANGLGLGPDELQGSPAASILDYHRVANGKLVGSEAHYMAEWGVITSTGAVWEPQFANPLGYETLIVAVALKFV